MTRCQDVQSKLSLLMDGALTPAEEEAVRAHLETCVTCRSVLRDLETIAHAAGNLGPRTPPDHLWLEVAGQIREAAGPTGFERRSNARGRPAPSRAALGQWIGLAAALVLVTFGAYLLERGTPSTPTHTSAGNAAPAGTVEAVAEELNLAMQHYERAIAELEALTKANAGTLDAAVAATLQQNIAMTDQAVVESRGALTENPGNELARESLFEALRRKVVVLQTTVTLMNEMRKGNPAGAAEAATAVGRKS